MMQALNATTHTTDAKAFIAWLDARAEVDKGKKIGTIGYCMGGPIVMRTAAAVPNRVGAGGSFHGGGLTTMNPDSPHLLIPQMKAQFLIAVAENDDMREPDIEDDPQGRVRGGEARRRDRGLPGRARLVPARHARSTTATESERAWGRMLAMFEKALA